MPDHSDEHCPGRAISLSQSKSSYAPWQCTVLSCDVCPTLIKLDAEILRANSHSHLVELSKKLRSLESLINDRHDPLTRLPPEIISEIFKFYCMDSSSSLPSNKLPLIIGEVCKYWRDVTLGTPQLWSTIIIIAHTHWPYDIDVASEWLSRSRSLPLSLDITFLGHSFTQTVDLENTTLSPLIHLLRSHSARWQNITTDATCCQSVLFLPLFSNLENLPTNLETFETYTEIYGANEVLEHNMFPLLLPKRLNAFGGSSMVGLPIGWERLTSLDVCESMYLDEFLHIIGHAPNLSDCSITLVCDVMDDSDHSNTLVTSHSLTSLDIQSSSEDSESVLSYLTLPSLKILRYTDLCYHPTSRVDLEILKAFLDRSSPTLDEFSFSIIPKDSSAHVDHWYKELPPITSLELDVTAIECASLEDKVRLTDHFLSLVFSILHDAGFPKLQRLALNIPTPTAQFWAKVYSVFQQPPPMEAAQTLSTKETSSPASHSLKYFDVEWIYHPNDKAPKLTMDPGVFSGLLEIERKFGVEILVGDEDFSYSLSMASNIPPPTAL